MNGISFYQAQFALDLAHARAAEFRAEADQHRLARRISRRRRVALLAAALHRVREAAVRPADEPAATLPRLTDYPYRS